MQWISGEAMLSLAIFINHIPQNFYERITHAQWSVSDSAELFVFLAGWSLRIIVGRPEDPRPVQDVLSRVLGRAVTLYVAQIAITLIAIAMLAAATLQLSNPLFLEWHNATAVFFDPVRAHIGLALLSHQLGYFDILPLYVVLMMIVAPVVVMLHRFAPDWVLPVSFLIYITSVVLGLKVRTWPTDGQWLFNPLCWQFIFVLGFAMGSDRGPGGWVRRHIISIRAVALPIVIVLAIMRIFNLWWDPTIVPEPRLLFLVSKTFVTPVRLIQFLALIAVFSAVFVYIRCVVPSLVGFLCTLGRNSLNVFCTGSLLSLAGQILRYYMRGGIVADTMLVVVGITLMGTVAWLSERPDRARNPA